MVVVVMEPAQKAFNLRTGTAQLRILRFELIDLQLKALDLDLLFFQLLLVINGWKLTGRCGSDLASVPFADLGLGNDELRFGIHSSQVCTL